MDLRLKEILIEKGLTLKELSVISGISQSNLSNYINGNISPTLDTLKRISNALNLPLTSMFEEENEIKLYVKHDGKLYEITNKDLLDIIEKKKNKF